MPNFEILDCTLRDGGYYNNWDFDINLVQKYLDTVALTGIKYIELGFRGFSRDYFAGAHAYTNDAYIKTLSISDNLVIGVMIDAKEILSSGFTIDDALNKLFLPKTESRVELVRIAVNFVNYAECKPIVGALKALGYIVGLNLMQSDGRSANEIKEMSSDISTWNEVEVLYFADSLGNMNEKDVEYLVENIKIGWHGKLGIHTHNNKGAGLANSLKAIELGVDWIDSTIMGMGRGAGNTATETLLCEVMKYPNRGYTPAPIFNLVSIDFESLHKKYAWGPNLYYHLAAQYNIHPTYVQFMISDARYGPAEIVSLLERLKTRDARSFNKNLLSPLSSNNEDGDWDVTKYCEGKSVLLLGAGPSIDFYNASLINFIKDKFSKLQVYSLNTHAGFPDKYLTGNIVIDELRALAEKDSLAISDLPIISPNTIQDIVVSKNSNHSFGVKVKPNTLEYNAKSCIIPYPIAFAYGLMFAHAAGAAEILLAGFDGYDQEDLRQKEMTKIIELYKQRSDALNIISITPTSYPVVQSSLFAPDV